jgi:hypothetical protein
MVDELERVWKETVLAQLRYCPGICLQRLRKTMKTSVRITGVPVEI